MNRFRLYASLIFLFTFSPFMLKAQEDAVLTNRCDTIEFITQLINSNTLESPHIGLLGFPSKQFHRYTYLAFMLTKNEWIDVFNNSSGSLKIYAYCALSICHGHEEIELLKTQLKNDTTRISYRSGCVIEHTKISEFIESFDVFDWAFSTLNAIEKLRLKESFRKEEFMFITEN